MSSMSAAMVESLNVENLWLVSWQDMLGLYLVLCLNLQSSCGKGHQRLVKSADHYSSLVAPISYIALMP